MAALKLAPIHHQALLRRLLPPLAGAVATLTLAVLLVGVIVIRGAVLERAQERALAMSVAERDTLELLMRSGDHRDLQSMVEQIAGHPDVAAARLIRPEGVVEASSWAAEIGRAPGAHGAQMSPDGDVMRMSIDGQAGPQVVHTLQPLLNKPACRRCHAESGPILGYQDVDVSISQHATGLLTFTTLSGLLALLYLGAVIGVAAPLISGIVGRPLSRLISGMDRVKAGDLSVQVEPTKTREINAVIDGFNQMVGQLQQGRQAEEAARRLQLERVEQLASIGQLAAGLAHEIRNPISGVKAVLEIVARDTPDQERRDVLHDAASELMRVDHIVRELLQYARPKQPVVSPFDLNAIVRDASRLTRAGEEDGADVVTVELEPLLPPVLGDPAQIRQVLVNLLLNARQAGPATGRVTVSTGQQDGTVWCRVQDEGPGVPLDKADAIFRPFVTTKAKGTGLGLAISRRIMELHGGALRLNNPGQSHAEFTLTLPVAPQPSQA